VGSHNRGFSTNETDKLSWDPQTMDPPVQPTLVGEKRQWTNPSTHHYNPSTQSGRLKVAIKVGPMFPYKGKEKGSPGKGVLSLVISRTDAIT